jgi:hypothetical protein
VEVRTGRHTQHLPLFLRMLGKKPLDTVPPAVALLNYIYDKKRSCTALLRIPKLVFIIGFSLLLEGTAKQTLAGRGAHTSVCKCFLHFVIEVPILHFFLRKARKAYICFCLEVNYADFFYSFLPYFKCLVRRSYGNALLFFP